MTLTVAAAWLLFQPGQPSVEGLRSALKLAPGVHVQAVTYNGAESEPFDMFEADLAPAWGRLTQYMSKPPNGFVADRAEYYSDNLVAAYSVVTPKGVVEQAPKHHRGGGAEIWLSSYSVLRCMAAVDAGAIQWSGDDHRRIAEFQTVTGELRPRTFDWKVKWDDLSEELEISCGSTPANVSTVTMSHWMPVARGGRWPGAARVTFGTGPDARQKRIEFVSVAALEASSTVPPPVFPKDVVLYELSTGRSLDSNLQPVQATADGAPATTSPPQSSEPALRWGTLAGGSFALALAGTVWYIRRVRRQRSV